MALRRTQTLRKTFREGIQRGHSEGTQRGHFERALREGLHLPNATQRHVRHARALHPSEAHAAKRDGERGESRASCGENATDVRTAIVPDEGSDRRSFGAITGLLWGRNCMLMARYL